MRSSALAGFLASAVFVSGSAGFASTFLVGPYLGEHVRHQSPRATLMSSAAPIDPLAAVQIPGAARLDGEPPASQTAHRLRKVENTTPAATTRAPAPTATPAVATTGSDMPGPITEEAFAPTAPSVLAVSSGGPLIATETTSVMVSSKLENGEPVLTLRVAPVIAAAAPTVDTSDPDNAVEPTVISAPPTEQALATPAIAAAPLPAPAAEPVAPPPPAEPAIRPRTKPALQATAPAPVEPQRRVKPRTPAPPARDTTTAAPALAPAPTHVEEPVAPPVPDPLNAPYIPSNSPTLGTEEPATSATGAPAPMAPAPAQPQSTGGPTPLTMPQ